MDFDGGAGAVRRGARRDGAKFGRITSKPRCSVREAMPHGLSKSLAQLADGPWLCPQSLPILCRRRCAYHCAREAGRWDGLAWGGVLCGCECGCGWALEG
eukprot:scaffold27287_cov38-Phaeocystis_antarctica.AAC.4